MSTIARGLTRFQVGAAATAITAATVLTPAAIAQARPDLVPAAPAFSSISTDLFGTDPILGPVTISLDTPVVPWWIGGNNANANAANSVFVPGTPGGTTIFEFSPLSLVPGFLKPLAGWFLNFVPRFGICFAGLGAFIGPYATLSIKTGAC